MGFCDKVIGFDEALANKDHVFRCAAAECLGVFFIIVIGCGSCIQGWENSEAPTLTQISLAFGLTVATVIHCTGHVSGGHVNPAVTLSMLVVVKITFVRAALYIGAQLSGAIVGAAVLRALTPDDLKGSLGQVSVDPLLTTLQGFFVECTLTFCLVITVCAVADKNRNTEGISPSFVIGLTVTAIHLFGVSIFSCIQIKYTGASVNPARAFGPCIVTGHWHSHWVYWFGPCLGGPLASILYYKLFEEVSSLPRSNSDLSELEETTSTLEEGLATRPLRGIIRKPRPRSDEIKFNLTVSSGDSASSKV